MILPGKSYETRFARRFEFLSTFNLPTGKYNSLPRKEYNFPQGKYNLPARANITHNSYTPRALGSREVRFRDLIPSSLRSPSHLGKRKRAPIYTAPGSVISHKTCHLADFIRHRRTSSQSDFIYGVDFIKNELILRIMISRFGSGTLRLLCYQRNSLPKRHFVTSQGNADFIQI